MKAEKNSFILYYQFREQTAHFTDEQLGRFMRGIFDYEIDSVCPEFNDPFLEAAFQFVKVILDINKSKYEAKCEKNSENGKKGGRPPIPQDRIPIPKSGKGFGD